MATDHHDELEGLRIRVAELEDLVQQLGQQLDGLSEHFEYRLQRHHERIEAVDDLVYEVDRVCSDVSALERAGRG